MRSRAGRRTRRRAVALLAALLALARLALLPPCPRPRRRRPPRTAIQLRQGRRRSELVLCAAQPRPRRGAAAPLRARYGGEAGAGIRRLRAAGDAAGLLPAGSGFDPLEYSESNPPTTGLAVDNSDLASAGDVFFNVGFTSSPSQGLRPGRRPAPRHAIRDQRRKTAARSPSTRPGESGSGKCSEGSCGSTHAKVCCCGKAI